MRHVWHRSWSSVVGEVGELEALTASRIRSHTASFRGRADGAGEYADALPGVPQEANSRMVSGATSEVNAIWKRNTENFMKLEIIARYSDRSYDCKIYEMDLSVLPESEKIAALRFSVKASDQSNAVADWPIRFIDDEKRFADAK